MWPTATSGVIWQTKIDMDILYIGKGPRPQTPVAATIGFFDGVHRGHQFLLRGLCDDARRDGMLSMAVTFDRHPREVLQTEWHPLLLTTFDERLALLRQTGIDICAVLPFNTDMAALSARQFMQQILLEQLNVRVLSIGYDHRFGHNREEGFADYVRYGRELGMEVRQNSVFTDGDLQLSSSLVRRLLGEGRVGEASRCLGRFYTLSGTVVGGEHVGRTLGFPTANVVPDSAFKLVPQPGAYAVRVALADDEKHLWLPAMMNIGTRPTYGQHAQTLEVNILDYEGDLYGRQLTVAFVERLRSEQAFDSPQALQQQLRMDAEHARQVLSQHGDL